MSSRWMMPWMPSKSCRFRTWDMPSLIIIGPCVTTFQVIYCPGKTAEVAELIAHLHEAQQNVIATRAEAETYTLWPGWCPKPSMMSARE